MAIGSRIQVLIDVARRARLRPEEPAAAASTKGEASERMLVGAFGFCNTRRACLGLRARIDRHHRRLCRVPTK
jgi:hypothetical protein